MKRARPVVNSTSSKEMRPPTEPTGHSRVRRGSGRPHRLRRDEDLYPAFGSSSASGARPPGRPSGGCARECRQSRFHGCGGRPSSLLPLVSPHLSPAVLRAGLPASIGVHSLRHTFAALSVANGEHPKSIQTALGHSSIQVTFDTYGHLFPDALEAAAQRLDATFREAVSGFPAASPRPGGEVVRISNKI